LADFSGGIALTGRMLNVHYWHTTHMHISAVIITYNEAHNIGRCLDALRGVADDIVVLDSFSSDGTAEICRAKGARFFQHKFKDYSDQKNRANALAKYPIILSVDADEVLGAPLQKSIKKCAENWGAHDAYRVNRLTNYCGHWIYHCGWYPDRKLRLFDRRKGRWGGPNPHEIVLMDEDSRIGMLAGDLLHFSYNSVEEHCERSRKYAELAIKNMLESGKKTNPLQVYASPAAKFLRNYIFRRGFLDGSMGFTICKIAALETWWKYKGLWEEQQRF
jgi:glycosyltransferase involved in cell wall biosynthesis